MMGKIDPLFIIVIALFIYIIFIQFMHSRERERFYRMALNKSNGYYVNEKEIPGTIGRGVIINNMKKYEQKNK
mgnify:CR=1 FL=1